MGKQRRFIGAFVLALTIAAIVGTPSPAFASPGGSTRGTCGFLQGIMYKRGAPDGVLEMLAAFFSDLFECDLEG